MIWYLSWCNSGTVLIRHHVLPFLCFYRNYLHSVFVRKLKIFIYLYFSVEIWVVTVILRVVVKFILCVALIMCQIFLSRRQPNCVVRTGSRLHVWWVAHASVWHHARQEPRHGGWKEAEVCHASSPSCAYRNKKNIFCQLYRNMQDVSWGRSVFKCTLQWWAA